MHTPGCYIYITKLRLLYIYNNMHMPKKNITKRCCIYITIICYIHITTYPLLYIYNSVSIFHSKLLLYIYNIFLYIHLKKSPEINHKT